MMSNRTVEFVPFTNMLESLGFVVFVHLTDFIRDKLFISKRNRTFVVTAFVCTLAVAPWNKIRFATDRTLATDRIRMLGNVFRPKLDALVHVLARHGPTFRVGLQCDTGGKSHFVGIGKSLISEGTKVLLT